MVAEVVVDLGLRASSDKKGFLFVGSAVDGVQDDWEWRG